MSVFTRIKYILLIASIFLLNLSGCNTANQDDNASVPSQTSADFNVTDKAMTNETVTPLQSKNQSDEDILTEGVSLIKDKKYPQAIGLLSQIKDNGQAENLLEQLRYIISGAYIANLNSGIAAIDNDSKVKIIIDEALYNKGGYDEVNKWSDIKMLSYAGSRLDALDRNGIIHSTKDTDPSYNYVADQLKSYTNLSVLSTYFDNYVLLSKTGSIYAYSEKFNNALDAFQDYISTWKDVVDVITGQMRIAALISDGSVKVADYAKYTNPAYGYLYDEIANWNNIIAISADNTGSIIGLKSDGTVVMSCSDAPSSFSYNISGWNDIIAISKSSTTLLGLKRDGTVIATGDNGRNQLDVSDWTDIVAIAAGNWISIGLKADGTLVIAGRPMEGVALPDISGVKNLYVPTITY